MRRKLLVPLASVAALSLVSCGKWFDNDDFLPSSPSVVNAIVLTTGATAIPANGFATASVTATISTEAALTHRIVVFNTTAGTFVGSGTPETTTIERTVDGTSAATVELRSSRTVETARVTAAVKDVAGVSSNEKLVSFTAASPQDLIKVIANGSAPADGATITAINAEISGGLPAGRRKVTFVTTLGEFVGDPASTAPGQKHVDVDADGGNHAVAYLRSPGDAVGTAFVTATVDSTPAVSATTSVQFMRAVPKLVLVTTDQPTVKQDFTPTIKVTVTLIRDQGVPTQQTVVTFRAEDSGSVMRGLFTNITRSNADGVASADFGPGPMSATGPLIITATAEGVSGTATVEVVP